MKLSTKIILAFAVIIITSFIDSAANYMLSLKVTRNTEFFNRSQEVMRISNQLQKEIIEMTSAFRGYLLTGDSMFLGIYNQRYETVPDLFEELKERTVTNTWQRNYLDTIDALHDKWVNYSLTLMEARTKAIYAKNSERVYKALFQGNRLGEDLNEEISDRFIEFNKSEYKSRRTNSEALIDSVETTRTISFIFLTLTVIMGIGTVTYLVIVITKRIATMVKQAQNITQGDFTAVEDRQNDELSDLSKSLNIMSGRLSKNIHELQHRNDELDKFAYVVSHDLKAPVRGINNVVQWVEEDLEKELSPQMREYLDVIKKRTLRMEDLINGLLEYARISEKNTIEEVDTHALVQDLVDTIVPRNFTVQLNNLPRMFSERIKLEQVFTNLVSNSVKYTPPENGSISISCTQLPGYYRFSVKDNGIGIDPAYHDKIFEMFQTLRDKHEKESTGIGLAIVKKIITEQHGTIMVNSRLNQGTEIIFTWPLVSKKT